MPIQLVCPSCKAKINVPDSMQGKRGKCKCGTELSIPVSAAAKPQSQKAVGAAVAKGSKPSNAAATQPAGPSIFDHLTTNDFNSKGAITPSSVFAPPSSSDAKVLKNYFKDDQKKGSKSKASSADSVKSAATAGAVLHFIGGVINLGFAALIFVAGELMQQAMGLDANATNVFTFFAIAFGGFAIWDFAAGTGLLLRHSWGWWITMVGLFFAVVDRIAELAISLFLIKPEGGVAGGRTGGYGLTIAGCVWLAYVLSSDKAAKLFNVNMNAAARRSIVFLLGLVLALGVNAGKYVLMKQADDFAQAAAAKAQQEMREQAEKDAASAGQ